MPLITLLLIYAATFILAELFKPKPDTENARPAALGDFNFPTATEGRAVPLLWGTVEITAPNIVWYGDLRTDRIREKLKTGLFSSKKIIVGYEYFVGIQFALCRGPMNPTHDGVLQIRVDDDTIYGNTSPITAVDSGTITVNEPELFGKDAGGIVGSFGVFPGTETQSRSAYLESVITGSPDILPAYRGTHYVIAEQVYIGNQPNLRPFKFTVRRIPDGLGLAAGSPGTGTELINGLDANPMNVLFEIMTDTAWGLAIPSGDIDLHQLRQNAQVLFDESNGFSALLDNPRKTESIIQEIERQVDGVLIRDTATGQYTFSLIRDTDIPSPFSEIPAIGPGNADSVEFSRASWSETTNEVRVSYPDPTKNYKESFALAQDMANEIIQASNVSVTERYMGVKNGDLANSLAWRDLRSLAIPVGKASIVTNRAMYQLTPGALIRVTWPPLGITDLLMRVSRLNFGELLNNKITIDAVEDVFTSQAASFAAPIDTSWTPLTQVVVALSEIDQLIFETPRMMNLQDPDNPLQIPRITTVARLSSGSGDEYTTLTRQDSTKGLLLSEPYVTNLGSTPSFVVAGELRIALPATGEVVSFPAQGTTDVFVDPFTGDSLSELVDASARTESEINNLLTLVYITDGGTPGSPDFDRDRGEFIIYEQGLESIGGSPSLTGLRLDNCYRGALDSTIQNWPAGSRVWFLGFGGAGISSEIFADQWFVDAKILPSTQESGTLAEAAATPTNAVQIDDGFRVNLPLSPNELTINTVRYDDAISFAITSNDIDFKFTRLNWRTIGGLKSVQGLNSDGTVFNPAGADAGDGLSYIWQLFDEGSPNIGSPNVIAQGQTVADAAGNDAFGIDVNDIYGVVADPNGGRLRIEVQAVHETRSPSLPSREKLVHSFNWTGFTSTFGGQYDFGTFLGRIPYGTVVSPGVVVVPQGSPGSPHAIPLLRTRLASGSRMSDGPGTGENGKLYLLANDASPASLLFDAQTVSPASTTILPTVAGPGSPQNWVGHTVNILHYHNTGRPIFFQVEDTANNRVVAWGILEPQTNTVPDSVNNT